MKQILKLEAFGILVLSVFLFSSTNFSWWWYPLLFFLPDLSIIFYAINTRVGATVYNLFHHMGIAIATLLVGWHFQLDLVSLAGIILLGHSAFDRMLGYGLKYSDDFKNTHLGRIEKK